MTKEASRSQPAADAYAIFEQVFGDRPALLPSSNPEHPISDSQTLPMAEEYSRADTEHTEAKAAPSVVPLPKMPSTQVLERNFALGGYAQEKITRPKAASPEAAKAEYFRLADSVLAAVGTAGQMYIGKPDSRVYASFGLDERGELKPFETFGRDLPGAAGLDDRGMFLNASSGIVRETGKPLVLSYYPTKGEDYRFVGYTFHGPADVGMRPSYGTFILRLPKKLDLEGIRVHPGIVEIIWERSDMRKALAAQWPEAFEVNPRRNPTANFVARSRFIPLSDITRSHDPASHYLQDTIAGLDSADRQQLFAGKPYNIYLSGRQRQIRAMTIYPEQRLPEIFLDR